MQENRSALDLLRADYTFVNERVARLYGLPNVKGNHFRRVTLPADSPRRGLLGHGSILTVTSYPDRTSPVVRGKWILENLLGVPPPPPPPDVPDLEDSGSSGRTLTIRERLAEHRGNPSCASCHALMDPLGFALENFNAVGVWRTIDETGAAIDASGTLPDGTAFAGRRGVPGRLGKFRFVRNDAGREAANLWLGARRRGLRPARRARDRPRRRGERLSVLGIDYRRRAEPTVSVAESGNLIISKRTLPRRTFLRGAGACIALPLLDAMVPALAQSSAPKAKRLGFIYMPNGVARNFDGIDFFTPKTTGKNFELSRILTPLAPYKSQLTVVSGLAHHQADAQDDGANGDHTRATSSWLSGARAKRTEGADVESGITADQVAASVIGKDTPLPSLELAIDLNFLSGQCENSYACIYMNTIAWRVADEPTADREQPAARVRAVVRQRRHDGAARRARAGEPQHPRLGDGGLLAPRAHARPERSHARRHLPRVRARGRTAHRRRRELERRRRPARARAAARHSREFRRPRQAHVRAAVARVPSGPDARHRRSCSAAS